MPDKKLICREVKSTIYLALDRQLPIIQHMVLILKH